MRLTKLRIRNFKSIRDLELEAIEDAMILVGQNSVGKTSVLNAVCALGGEYQITESDFNGKKQNIEITARLEISEADLERLHKNRAVSSYHRMEAWRRDFCSKLPSYQDGVIWFTYIVNQNGTIRYADGVHKDNKYIAEIFPKIYYLDNQRDLTAVQDNLLAFLEDDLLNQMRSDCCLFDRGKKCNHCFSCIGLLNKKTVEELNAFETQKLLEYKLYQMNLNDFSGRVNENFQRNSGFHGEIHYEVSCNTDRIFQVNASMRQRNRQEEEPISYLGKGMRSIYLLSLLETYMEDEERLPGIILMEDPEIFLHPKLQKVSSEILYRLSKKSQVIFSTHSPNLLFQFNSRQIRQMVLDEYGFPVVREHASISAILDNLGYTASDLLNVSFVFIVEGKQDKSRLPLLLYKYYSEVCTPEGEMLRIAIITTNSCTNIKTYANLKYMNQLYLRNQFLMIRDGDGKDTEELVRSLCGYYAERNKEDVDKLPDVTRDHVLVLKYYSFENYFLNPAVMAKIGVIESEEKFYEVFLEKWKEYLHRIKSGQHLIQVIGKNLETTEDVKTYLEQIRIYVRGHNLYDIFYGRYRKQEGEILRAYIQEAPREEFADILGTIDSFLYFDNRRKIAEPGGSGLDGGTDVLI